MSAAEMARIDHSPTHHNGRQDGLEDRNRHSDMRVTHHFSALPGVNRDLRIIEWDMSIRDIVRVRTSDSRRFGWLP